MEELKKLRRSINTANAKIGFLSDGFLELKQQFGEVSNDLDAFLQVYIDSQKQIEDRIKRLEKHAGFNEN